MKCVCIKRGQWRRKDGTIVTYAKHDVDDFDKCPPFARPLKGEVPKDAPKDLKNLENTLDFKTAERQELIETDYDVMDLKSFIEKEYDKKTFTKDKEKLVDILLDCRYRKLSINPNDMVK